MGDYCLEKLQITRNLRDLLEHNAHSWFQPRSPAQPEAEVHVPNKTTLGSAQSVIKGGREWSVSSQGQQTTVPADLKQEGHGRAQTRMVMGVTVAKPPDQRSQWGQRSAEMQEAPE